MKYTLKSNWMNACLILFLFCQMPSISFAQPQKLKLSDNHRFLVKEDGSPFVWIGETNWFFAKLPPTTIDSLLDVRQRQGYTMMFVSCREKLYNGAGPGTINQPNEAWWAYLDGLPRKDDRKWTVWEAIQYDYQQTYEGIPKPTLDAEAWYENNKDFCGADAFTIRRRAYFTILAGAFGHTYGAGGIWDGLTKGEGCSEVALEAIHYPGAKQIGFVSSFFHALGDSFLKLTPSQSLITAGNSDKYDTHIQASVADDGSFALVYSASDRPFQLDLSKLSGRKLKPIWYNPRTHQYITDQKVQLSVRNNFQEIDPPGELGAGNDWVLILGRESLVADFISEGS